MLSDIAWNYCDGNDLFDGPTSGEPTREPPGRASTPASSRSSAPPPPPPPASRGSRGRKKPLESWEFTPELRRCRQRVGFHAALVTECLTRRMVLQMRGHLRTDLFASPILRRRLADLLEASRTYSVALSDWQEELASGHRKGA